MRLHDRVLGLILIGLAALLGFHSANLAGPSGDRLGPGLFPNLIAMGIAACGLVISLKARSKPGPMIVVDPRLKLGSGLFAVSIMPAGVIFYLLVIDWLGFLLTAAIMIAPSFYSARCNKEGFSGERHPGCAVSIWFVRGTLARTAGHRQLAELFSRFLGGRCCNQRACGKGHKSCT